MKNNLKYIYEALGKTESLRIAEFLVNHYSRKIPSGIKIIETNFSDKSLKGDYDVDRNKIRIRTSYSKKSTSSFQYYTKSNTQWMRKTRVKINTKKNMKWK